MTKSITYKKYEISYTSEGKGEVLIFLHGWPTNSLLWKHQVDKLKENYQTITIDWLGFGKSDKPINQKYTFTIKKEVLNAVVSTILKDHEKVNIIAHDIGGPAGILWASENPERVKRLILLNTIVFPFSTPMDKLSHVFFNIPVVKEILVSDFGLRSIMRTINKSSGKIIKRKIREIIEEYANVKSEIRLKTILEPVSEGMKNELLSLEEKFKELNTNKFLVIAKADLLLYAHMKKLHENNPNIPAFFIDRCGHHIPIDQPEELTEILITILEKEV